MPQTVVRLPTAAANLGDLGNDWSNPNNALTDNGVNATAVSTLNVTGTDVLSGLNFNFLAEDGGPIPVGASLVGIRFHYDVITGGGNPHALGLRYNTNVGNVASYTGTTQAVVTVGYGTLSAGSTHALGNVYDTEDLSTDAGSAAARVKLRNDTLAPAVTGGPGAVTSNATYGIDYFQVTVAWVLRVDRTGGAKAAGKAGGVQKPTVTPRGGGKSPTKAGNNPLDVQTTLAAAGGKAATRSGGAQKPLVTRAGGAVAGAKAGGPTKPFITSLGGGKAAAKAGGSMKAQMMLLPAGGKAAAKAGGRPGTLLTRAGGAVVGAKAGGLLRSLITQAGGSKASGRASASLHAIVTQLGGALAGPEAGAGPSTVVSFAISGVARHASTDAPIPSVRVDVYRASDHSHMGRRTTDAAGSYAVAIPFTGNEGETFWARFYKAGTPNTFATTDEDLELIEAIVQTV